MTERNIQLLHKEALQANIGVRYGSPWFVEAPLKSTAQQWSKTYTAVWFEVNWKHEWT